jgi:cytoskeleton protein RodZ
MPPIGETLREARMRQRLDIADVEERTKIRAKYLRALENEEWGLLPGPTFVKTFLRTYAEAVGVDPYLLVEEYRVNEERGDGGPEFQPLAPLPARDRRDRRGGRRPQQRPPRRGGLILGAVAVALVAFLLVLGLVGGDDDSGGGDGGGEQAATTTTTAPANAQQRQRQRQRARQRRRRAAANQAGVNVRIAPTAPTYVCVDNGPGTAVVFENTLDAPRAFRNAERVRVNLGLRSVTVTLNGRPVTIEQSGEPVALELTRDGSTEIDAGEAPCA